jgi:hypothetical protein
MFLKSLKTCRCIITLSEYNLTEIIKLLNKMNLIIPVEVVYHPINLLDINKFNYKEFITNPNRSIINIGAWLRNPYTIYTLNLPNLGVKKIKLKGKYMSEYFIPTNYNITTLLNDIIYDNNLNEDICYTDLSTTETIQLNLSKNPFNKLFNNLTNNLTNNSSKYLINSSNRIIYSRSNTNINYYILYLINYIKSIHKLIPNIQNIPRSLINQTDTLNLYDEYDLKTILVRNNIETDNVEYKNDIEYIELITQNIVFGHYLDCSVSNTILECILYNTPIIVNNHPAIIEYLGKDYPLYYSEPKYDSEYKFTLDFTLDDISNTHQYLLNLDKTNISPETFNKKLSEIFLKYSKKSALPNNKFNTKFNTKLKNICGCFKSTKVSKQ